MDYDFDFVADSDAESDLPPALLSTSVDPFLCGAASVRRHNHNWTSPILEEEEEQEGEEHEPGSSSHNISWNSSMVALPGLFEEVRSFLSEKEEKGEEEEEEIGMTGEDPNENDLIDVLGIDDKPLIAKDIGVFKSKMQLKTYRRLEGKKAARERNKRRQIFQKRLIAANNKENKPGSGECTSSSGFTISTD